MKKALLPTILAAAVPALAQQYVQTASPEPLAPSSGKTFEISTRVGAMGEREKVFDFGPALQLEGRATLLDSPFDIVARGYFGKSDIKDDLKENGPVTSAYSGRVVGTWESTYEGDVSVFGGSLQAQFNFARDAAINPYAAAGIVYEKSKFDIEDNWTSYSVNAHRRYGSDHYSFDEDGTAFVARLGAEFDLAPFWFVAEGSWMSGLYGKDDLSSDDAQFEVSGRAGWQFTDRCRLDAGVDYYTEWKQIFIGAGATFCF